METMEGVESTTASLASLDKKEPLKIHIVSNLSQSDDKNNEKGSYNILQRIVSAHPVDPSSHASIETVLEAYQDKDNTSDSHWMRVAVKSGPDCPVSTVHASFQLPSTAAPPMPGAVLSWTAFSEHPDHPVLCVLTTPTTVSMYDVYPDPRSSLLMGGEGWTVRLPFECCGIFAIGQGLLLQRSEDADDSLEEDDGFFLKSPPKMSRDSPLNVAKGSAVSSLFSLQHPLDDVLPVSQLQKDSLLQSRPITDVFEKILWVGTCQWVDPTVVDRQVHQQVLAVSYHTVHQRHAIWLVQDAPPSATKPPLHQLSRQWRSSNITLWEHDAEDLELLGMTSSSNYAAATRDEALADALGVRKTPRKSIEPSQTRSRHRTTNEQQQQQTSFFSPRSVDVSGIAMEPTSIFPASGPFSSIQANVAFQCLYEESKKASLMQASNIFVASNRQASGTLTLCLVCPRDDKDESSNELRMYSLLPTAAQTTKRTKSTLPNSGYSFDAVKLETLSCVSAQPIQSIPIPPCFLPHHKHRRDADRFVLATDILVLSERNSFNRLWLYRADKPVVGCGLPGSLRSLSNPVLDRVTLAWNDESNAFSCARVRVTIMLHSGSLAEKALAALDAALYSSNDTQLVDLAIKLRVDCVSLEQRLIDSAQSEGSALGDVGWKALEAMLSSVAELELLGQVATPETKGGTSASKAWECLLASDFHYSYSIENDNMLPAEPSNETEFPKDQARHVLASMGSLTLEYLQESGLKSITPRLFDSLHMLYEDFKLYVSSGSGALVQLASLLVRICRTAKIANSSNPIADAFLDHYILDFGEHAFSTDGLPSERTALQHDSGGFTTFAVPPSILRWIEGVMKAKRNESVYENVAAVNDACARTILVIRILSALFTDGITSSRDVNVICSLLEEGFSDASKLREELPAGVTLPILEVLYRCRYDPALADLPGWSSSAWSLVGREDLRKNMEGVPALSSSSASSEVSSAQTGDMDIDDHDQTDADRDKDGLNHLEKRAAMLFPEDNRIHEAARLLRSSRPIFLRVLRSVEISDHDFEKMKQNKLQLLSRRALALPIGRGMLTIGSLRPVAAEPLPLPELCLKGRVPPTNSTLALDISEAPSDIRVWPEFHNGVAAGLRLPLEDEPSESSFKITRTWIVYNRPPAGNQPQSEDNNNDSESQPDIKSHAHGGLLLALGLRGHLTMLEMSDIYEYLTQGTVTTTVGVLLGMAANRRGSCDMSVSKMLCLHIPSLIPQHFSAIDVASSVQTAAVTGAGLLFQRSSHRMMTEFLLNEIGKRPDTDVSVFDREAYTLSCGIALGMVNLCLAEKSSDVDQAAGIADLRVEERLIRYIHGGVDNDERRRMRESNDRFSLPNSSNGVDNEKCSIVYEGDAINTDVTAPGATLALGLMFMKTGNRTIASALALPDTHFLLEFVRPDFLALRVIARALILWNDVEPTREWIDEQIPLVVQNAYAEMQTIAKNNAEGKTTTKSRRDSEYDRRAVRQIYSHVVAGACFAMGLRYAGTGDERAKAVLFERVLELHKLREANDPVSIASRPEFPILETCLGFASTSLAMVLAGTGDLDALRLFKILRWRCDDDIKVGSHMVYGMAIGLLFLGGGTCTLGREPEDIAALVTALFPRYPVSTSDNQYHLQALRHLYALAVKHRELVAVDIDTGESVHVAVELTSNGMSKPQRMMLPCLLPNSDVNLHELRVESDKFYPLKINLQRNGTTCAFFVKKRNSRFSDLQDPYLQHSVFGTHRIASADLVQSLTESPFLLAYADYLCDPVKAKKTLTVDPEFASQVLSECLSKDAPEALAIYLSLHHAIVLADTASPFLWDLRLIRAYYQERIRYVKVPSTCPLSTELLAHLMERAERLLARKGIEQGALSFYDIE